MNSPQIYWNNKPDSVKLNKTNGLELILYDYSFIQFNRVIDDDKIVKTKAQIIGFTFGGDTPPKNIIFYPYRDNEHPPRWATPIIMGKQRMINSYELDSIEIIDTIPGSPYKESKKT
jgi:hypothetical protein